MTKPIIQIGAEQREMTDAEFAQWQIDAEEAAEAQTAADAKETARQSALAKLDALGITAQEIAALVGA